ncbi:MAG: tryptophan synthase subunit alpha [Candidatus Omnitrophica bacterium]|nr:tryptophan synthase subunit alpha [Candidatus Omnitrophota bacterium]MBU4487634.1 tryptophan synthase subunit alpha [Candidatus Omnitrophota bacterium]MCG2705033.1 tryptophan synthase subunit alpha [Candidatus Omnitrophota bacterium]
MNRIDKKFKELKKKKGKAFIAYITGGYPGMAATEKLVLCLEKSGVDLVEIGVPFSDPMADGPIIQYSSEVALAHGATLKKLLRSVENIRQRSAVPIVFMSYYNPIYRYGVEKFVNDASRCGVDGVIIPDLPLEEAAILTNAASGKKFSVIFLAAPTSTRERLKKIAKKSRGFIYYVSLTGVTGTRRRLAPDITKNIKSIKALTDKPVCVGFGVSNASQAKLAARVADGVIIGSAIIKIIEGLPAGQAFEGRVGRFAAGLAKAIHGA